VTVAQAFHWFDGPRALAEIHRVLRPGGALALVWNRRRMEDEIHGRIEELLAPYRGDVPAHATEEWRSALDGCALFEPGVEVARRTG
jgi:SAM-dependent methyltransferase